MATETILLPKRSTFASASKLAINTVSRLSDYDERPRPDILSALAHEVFSGHRVFLAIDRQLTDAGTVFVPKMSYRVDPGEPIWREAVEQRFAEAASAHRVAVAYGLWYLWLNLRARGYTDEDAVEDRPWFDWPQAHPDEGVLTWDDSSIDDPQWNLGGVLAENAELYPFIENYGELIQRIRREAVAVEKLLPEQSDWPPKRMTFAQKAEAFLALTPDSPRVQELVSPRKRKVNGAEVAVPKRPAYDRDHEWLRWHESKCKPTYRKPATIRDEWNLLSDECRKQICPTCWARIAKDKSGTAVVNQALSTARAELGRPKKDRPTRKKS